MNFLVSQPNKSYVSTILWSIKCALLLCLKNNGHTLIKNILLLKNVIIWPFNKPQSLFADHHNTYNNNRKVWNIVRITKLWPKDIKQANVVGKNGDNRLAQQGWLETFNLLKNAVSITCNKARHNKMSYASKLRGNVSLPGGDLVRISVFRIEYQPCYYHLWFPKVLTVPHFVI